MAEITTLEIKEFLDRIQGQKVCLRDIRTEFNILAGTKSFDSVRNIMFQLAEQKVVTPLGNRGEYRVVQKVRAVPIFSISREKYPIFDLNFPKDFEKGMQLDFAGDVVVREGDLITIGGTKSSGKTTLCINFTAENVDKRPILMGNEYTVLVEDQYEPSPRFYNRLERMSAYIKWLDEDGKDKVTLLPVKGDYAEHIVKNKINIIDWINLDGDRLFDISKILERIKNNLGHGIGIVALQKGENIRGGQFVRDFSDLELQLDPFGISQDDVLLTIKGVKEKTAPIVGKTYAYTIIDSGTKIINFREVKDCPDCKGSKYVKNVKCITCQGKGKVDS